MASERLQKIIARAGLAARRKAEALITEGRVRVNGQIVSELGAKADPVRDRIEVDVRRIHLPRAHTYILLWKPEGVVTTASDELGRPTVLDQVKGVEARLFPVGRLDLDAEGLLLLTDDGDVAAALTHPSGQITRTYRAKVRGQPTDEVLNQLRAGVELEDGPAKPTDVHRYVPNHPGRAPARGAAWIELSVTEGRNHLVKRLFEAVGHPVIRLRRVKFGPLDLAGLKPGKWRHLHREEIRKLQALARGVSKKRAAPKQPG